VRFPDGRSCQIRYRCPICNTKRIEPVPTLKTLDLTCPNCEWTFFSDAAVPDAGHRRKRTDFHVTSNGVGVPSITYGVHLCDSCGFAGPESWFNGESHVSDALRRRVWDELAPHIARGPLPHFSGWCRTK
jgi:hypothetical protein